MTTFSTVLAVLATFSLLWLSGILAVSLLGLDRKLAATRNFLEIAAGTVLFAWLAMVTIVAGGKLSLLLVYLVVGILVVTVLFKKPHIRFVPSITLPATRRAQWLIGMASVVLLLLAVGALRDRLLWDAWAFWTFKARVLFVEGTLPPTLLDLNGPYPWTHPEYPLGIATVDWLMFRHAGAFIPAAASLGGLVWLASLVLLLWQGLKDEAGEGWAAATALAVVLFWPVTSLAIGGYSEVLIGLAILAAVIELIRGVGAGLPGSVARLGLFLSFGVVAKNEGLALAVIGAFVAIVALWQKPQRSWRGALPLLMPFVVLAPWYVFTRIRTNGAEHIGGMPALTELLDRIPFLLGTFVDLVTTRAWIPLPFILILGLVARFLRSGRDGRAAWCLILGYFLVTQVVYLLTPLDLEWLVINSYFRIVGVLVPAVLLLSVREIALYQKSAAHASGAATKARVQGRIV